MKLPKYYDFSKYEKANICGFCLTHTRKYLLISCFEHINKIIIGKVCSKCDTLGKIITLDYKKYSEESNAQVKGNENDFRITLQDTGSVV